jgi:hypothetical protein
MPDPYTEALVQTSDGTFGDVARYWRQIISGEFTGTGPPFNSYSSALEAMRRVKVGAGMLFGFSVYSTAAAAQWILLFDKQTAPVANDLPRAVWAVGAGNTASATAALNVSYIFPGRFFLQGCWIANSSTAEKLTAGSADCWFDAQFI